MGLNPKTAGKFRKAVRDFANEERLTRMKLYKEISKRTGYKETDIAKVIKTFHHVLCDEFSSGKTIFTNTPFYTLYIQKVKGRKFKGFNGEDLIKPDMDKIFFRTGSAFNNAVGWVNAVTKDVYRKKKERK